MQKSIFPFSIIILLAMATGCHKAKYAATNTGSSETLYQHQWNLEELDGQPVCQGSVHKTAHLLFSPGQANSNSISGNTGCNNLRGSFEISGTNVIKFSPLATTKMACPGDNIETKFLDALSKADNWSIINDQLVLNNGKNILAKFRAMPAQSKTGEIGAKFNGTWELNYISGKRIAFDGLYPDKKPQLVFTDDKTQVSGHTGCNAFSSTFTADGYTINIAEPKAMTMMACGGEGEKTFLDMLKKVNKYDINDMILTFMIDDIAVMRFVKK